MAQFDVFRNTNRRTASHVPYRLDVQNDLLASLRTRVVAPLVRADAFGAPVRTLTPTFDVLGERVASLAAQRTAILRTLDILISGL